MENNILSMSINGPQFKKEEFFNEKNIFETNINSEHNFGSNINNMFVNIEMINVLVGGKDLSVLNRNRQFTKDMTLGSIGIGKIINIPEICLSNSQKYGFKVNDIVLITPFTPCFKCEQCSLEHWNDCKDKKRLGSDINGVAQNFAKIPIQNLSIIDINPDVEKICNFLMYDIVAKSIWLSTQEFISKEKTVGLIGRPNILKISSIILDEYLNIDTEELNQWFNASIPRFDILVDFDNKTLNAEAVPNLVRTGGTFASVYNDTKLSMKQHVFIQKNIKYKKIEQSAVFLALEWIKNNQHNFNNVGVAFDFSKEGTETLLKKLTLKQEREILYFELRKNWLDIFNEENKTIYKFLQE